MTRLEEKSRRHLVKSFLDILVLAMLIKNPVHGYKLLEDIHTTFGLLLSPGTLYPLLYRLEKETLIEGDEIEKKKVYRLTDKGQRRVYQIIRLYKRETEKIMRFIETKMI